MSTESTNQRTRTSVHEINLARTMDRHTDSHPSSQVSSASTREHQRTRIVTKDQPRTKSRDKEQSKPSGAVTRDVRPGITNAADTSSRTRSESCSPDPSAANPNYQESTANDEEFQTRALRTFFSGFEELQQLVRDAKQEMDYLASTKQSIQVKRLEEKNAELEAALNATRASHLEEKHGYDKEFEDLKLSEAHFKTKCEKVNQELTRTQRELERQKSIHSEEMQRHQQELTKAIKELDKVKAELSETKSRLSRQMSNTLTENNPQIADLSDSNRPSKLGEKHSELYDNEWTDAFEKLDDVCGGELKAIEKLLDILMDVNEFCKAKSEEQTRILKQAACMSNTDLIQIRDTPELRKQIKELRKYTSELSIQAVCKEYALKTQEKNREMFRHQIVCKYIDGCVKLCWLMNAQDPPVVFATSVSPNSDFDSNIYRHYTKSGSKVQFMVWPALLLHEGGPILTKGVAQGHSVPKSTPGASVYEARSHTNAPEGQSASDGRTPLGTREAWGTSDKTKGPLMSDERNIPSVTARSISENSTQYYDAPNATRGQTQRAQSKPGYSQQSAQPFPITEDGHYRSDANVGRDVTSQSNTRNTCYVDDPFDKLAEFNNQSSNTSSPMLTKISDQPTRRLNTFSSSVNVPISVDVTSNHDMQLFYSYMRFGEVSCRNLLGEARYNKCVNYYNNVVLPTMTHGYRK